MENSFVLYTRKPPDNGHECVRFEISTLLPIGCPLMEQAKASDALNQTDFYRAVLGPAAGLDLIWLENEKAT